MKRRSNRQQAATTRRRSATRSISTRGRATPFVLDGTLVTSAALLAGLGIVMNYSTTAALEIGEPIPALAVRHTLGVVFAGLCAVAASRLPLIVWARIALPAYGVSVLLLALTPVLGIEANGAQRWLAVPGLPISVQPSEPTRLFTVLALAGLLARSARRRRRRPEPPRKRRARPRGLPPPQQRKRGRPRAH